MDNEELENQNTENSSNINDNELENELNQEQIMGQDSQENPNDTPLYPKKKKHSPCLIATGILAGLSLVGVIIILIFMFCCKDTSCSSSKDVSSKQAIQTGDLKIAYINTDSIMFYYNYAKDLEAGLKTFQTSLESNYQAQGNKLQSDIENYMKNGDKLTLTQQKQKEEELSRRQQEFPLLQQKMMAQLQERQLEDNKKLLNAVYAFINDYNSKNQKFNIILSRSYVSSTVLYADEGFDITQEIIDGLNKEYKSVKKK
jgi:outer membrane protein